MMRKTDLLRGDRGRKCLTLIRGVVTFFIIFETLKKVLDSVYVGFEPTTFRLTAKRSTY